MGADEVDPGWPPPASHDVDTLAPPAQRWSARTGWVVAASVAAVCVGVVTAAFLARGNQHRDAGPAPATGTFYTAPVATTTAGNVGPCGPDEATAVAAALAKIPPDAKTGKPWNPAPESSAYNACADLSAVVLTVQDATRSSPDQVLFFHRGTFVQTATPRPFAFTQIEKPASTESIVVLTYRSRQSCDACEDGTLTTVGFQWQGDRVTTLDPLPESPDSPP
ncbi:LppP/LprE family lipoprotein [Mycobacterium sp. 1423905.2]|uniref:LppP/LprE family lipoprotein n=1 Tax=Mycobacterium sp. 1423905.2 TaxID=1856859 RepID=UPI0008005BB2|nr:LppP/LprE family lipoprotein [Mycobacterium sp. 1423905.2]OBJ56284.1 hypothetical protein A9W95_13890 [Mycobacterium sp. 1423905.2]